MATDKLQINTALCVIMIYMYTKTVHFKLCMCIDNYDVIMMALTIYHSITSVQ